MRNLSPMEEHRLYLSDKAAWSEYVAPRWAKTLAKADEQEKRRLWRIAGPELKAAIRKVAKEGA